MSDKNNAAFSMEGLENRQLLSASYFGLGGGCGGGGAGGGRASDTILFNQAPTAVQNGLDSLASADNLAAPTASQTVILGNTKGVETYTIDITSTGTKSALTVDVNGNPLTAASKASTTFGAITDTAVTNEISAIATALNLTAPASTTTVSVNTPASGQAVYTVTLISANSTARHARSTTFSVDALGNPTGNTTLPFSVMLPAVQNGLNSAAPAGATTLAADSTQPVNVKTINGVTSYSVTFKTTGVRTTVTVDSSGTLTSLPSYSTAQFQNIPAAAANEIQTLATADGVSGTISATQKVLVYDETNNITLYSVSLSGTNSASQTIEVRITVDQNGNPTTLPSGNNGFGYESGNGNGGRFDWLFGTLSRWFRF